MGQCLIKIAHKNDKCNSSDGLQIFENEGGKLTGYCFACDTYVPDPLGDGAKVGDIPKKNLLVKTRDQIIDEMNEIAELSSIDLPKRRLNSRVLGVYDIKIGMSKQDGTTPTFAFFPYTKNGEIVKYKVKHLISGSVWSVGIDNEVDLFGWEQAKKSGAKRLIITEGEFDCPALLKILETYTKDSYKDYIPAICSIPNGASSARRDISRLLPEIRKYFKDVVLCFDTDKAGQDAAREVCKIFPEAKVVEGLPAKDANDCLVEGLGKATYKALSFHSDKPKNTRLVWGRDVHDRAKIPAVRGFSWPWKNVDDATKGIRLGETIYIGAAPKMGKSELVNAIAAWLLEVHGWKVLLAKPEESNNKTYKMVAGKITSTTFMNPDKEFDGDAYERAGTYLKENLAMVDLYQHVGYQSLKEDIYAAAAEGCKAVFIDPITNLVNGLSSADQNTKLQEIAQDLAAVALDLNIVIFIFCHLRNPDAGEPHERGGKVLSSQFAGSRAMARSCNLMFGLEGNRDPDLPAEERNLRYLVLLEDREFGNAGRYGLYWDENTGQFNEV